MPAARRTGLDVLGDMPWGTHFCLFYETKPDLLEILLPFFRAGLELDEQCIWVLSKNDPVTKEEAWAAVEQFLSRPRPFLRKNVEILSYDQFFLERGEFRMDCAGGRLLQRLEQALSAGKPGVRFGGGSAWLLHESGARPDQPDQPHRPDFLTYERYLDSLVVDRPILALCNFPIRESTAADMLDAVHTHHFGLAKRRGAWNSVQVATAHPRLRRLTAREVEALTWTAKGKSAAETAAIMHVSKRTVDAHVQNAVAKLGAANKTQAVVLALLLHIVEV